MAEIIGNPSPHVLQERLRAKKNSPRGRNWTEDLAATVTRNTNKAMGFTEG
jgi:hypothetical protein